MSGRHNIIRSHTAPPYIMICRPASAYCVIVGMCGGTPFCQACRCQTCYWELCPSYEEHQSSKLLQGEQAYAASKVPCSANFFAEKMFASSGTICLHFTTFVYHVTRLPLFFCVAKGLRRTRHAGKAHITLADVQGLPRMARKFLYSGLANHLRYRCPASPR